MQNAYIADKETNEEVARYLKRVTGNDYSADRRFISSVLLVSVGLSVVGQLDYHRIDSLTRRGTH